MSFDNLLGPGSAARQLLVYGVGYEIARALLGPVFTQIEYDINSNSPIVELSPAELADLVVRGVIGNEPDAAARAKVFGLDAGKFQEMVRLAGEPPGLQQVLEMWRRGIVPTDAGIGAPSLNEAIRTSRIYSYWTDAIGKFQFQPVSPADLVDAVQRNQITEAEGVMLSYFAGLGNAETALPSGANTTPTQDAFTILLNTRGNPPSPSELLELAKRGYIPWGNLDPATKSPNPQEISFAQGIYEGDSKDKWLPEYAKLAEYLPPPRTIVSLLSKGVITAAQAQTLFQQQGLTPALAAVYVASASSTRTAKPKQLNVSAIEQLYIDKAIDQPTAQGYLTALGYTASEAALILETATLRQTMTDLQRNETRIANYYIAHKIDQATASTMLGGLGLPAAQITQLIQGWTIDRQANVKRLTPAQITAAWEIGAFTQDQAQASLEADGYTPYDAWVLLSIKHKSPLPNPPPPGPPPIQ